MLQRVATDASLANPSLTPGNWDHGGAVPFGTGFAVAFSSRRALLANRMAPVSAALGRLFALALSPDPELLRVAAPTKAGTITATMHGVLHLCRNQRFPLLACRAPNRGCVGHSVTPLVADLSIASAARLDQPLQILSHHALKPSGNRDTQVLKGLNLPLNDLQPRLRDVATPLRFVYRPQRRLGRPRHTAVTTRHSRQWLGFRHHAQGQEVIQVLGEHGASAEWLSLTSAVYRSRCFRAPRAARRSAVPLSICLTQGYASCGTATQGGL